jgi:hypothetical protein
MITCHPDTIKTLTRTADNAERFQVGLRDDEASRLCVSQISLLEPGVECVVCILNKEEWNILQGAFEALKEE